MCKGLALILGTSNVSFPIAQALQYITPNSNWNEYILRMNENFVYIRYE
jgi:hypothetical protein